MTRQTSAEQLQTRFWRQMGGVAPFLSLLDSLADGLFFAKDLKSRMIWVSQRIWRRFGLSQPWEVAGKTDYEFFPKHVADSFVRDDKLVLRTGQPIIGRVEIWFDDQRRLDWFLTTKFPILNPRGRPIGLLGLIQDSAQGNRAESDSKSPLSRALKYVEAHHDRPIGVEELAAAVHLSPRQLRRRLRHELGMNIHELVAKARIQAASEALLREGATIAAVAAQFGYCDQSAFTRQFRVHTAMTPLAFLRKYGRRTVAED